MKILLCSDGNAQAERAARFIAPIAQACGAEVTLVGIVEAMPKETELQDRLRQHAHILLDRGVKVELITKNGYPVEEIQVQAELGYDLVVIGAERKGTRGPFCMSAKAYKIIKMIQPPVLVVIGEKKTLKRVLICSGGRRYIDPAIALLGKMAGTTEVAATLLHVTAGAPLLYAHLVPSDVEKLLASKSTLGRNLRREKEALTKFGIPVEVRVRQGFVVEEILKEVTANDYDMVVTGSAPAGGRLRTYVMGDVTSEIVNSVNCPVLVTRARHSVSKGPFSWFSGLFGSSGRGTSSPG
jgi:nucleotide-binding universal stress UspA family protein